MQHILLNHCKAIFVANAILFILFIKKCYSDFDEFAWQIGIEECKAKASKFQSNRNNTLSESISDYFEKLVTIPLLDHLPVEIERRFDHVSISVYSGLVIIHSKMVSLAYKNVNWRGSVLIFPKMIFNATKRWRQIWNCRKHIG